MLKCTDGPLLLKGNSISPTLENRENLLQSFNPDYEDMYFRNEDERIIDIVLL